MQAIIYSRHDAEGIRLTTKHRHSTNSSSHLLCKVSYAGLNPVDVKFLVGDKLPKWCSFLGRFAVEGRTVGFDFSGVVVHAPPGDARFKVGDEVFGTAPPGVGTFCEEVVVPIDQVALKPQSIGMREAATLPLVGITALQALKHENNLSDGQHLLLIGASGGVGHIALQVAKALGARVTAVCSGRNAELVRALGADRVVDYVAAGPGDGLKAALRAAVEAEGRPFDLCFDTVTSYEERDLTYDYMGALLSAPRPAAASGKEQPLLVGRYVTIGGPVWDWMRAGVKRLTGLEVGSDRHRHFWIRFPNSAAVLGELSRLTEGGARLRPRVEDEADLRDEAGVRRLFARITSRRVVGKCVIRVAGSPGDDPACAAGQAAAVAPSGV